MIWTTDAFSFVSCPTPSPPAARSCRRSATRTRPSWCARKTGRVIGALVGLLIMMKGLPLAYGKDMQEDKEPMFEVSERWTLCLAAMTGMIARPEGQCRRRCAPAPRAASSPRPTWPTGWSGAWACRSARPTTSPARSCKLAEDRGCGLEDLSLADMQAIEGGITDEVFQVLSVESSVASRTSFGGTAPSQVIAQVESAKERFL